MIPMIPSCFKLIPSCFFVPFEKKTSDLERRILRSHPYFASHSWHLGQSRLDNSDVGDLFAFRMSDGKSTKALYLVLKALLLMYKKIPNNHRLAVWMYKTL